MDHVNFWPPCPRRATKNKELNVHFFWNRLYYVVTYHTKQHMPMSRTTIPMTNALANTMAIDNPEK